MIVLVNLGTPDAPTRSAVKRYLKQFLSYPRVVEIPRLGGILNLIILPFRSACRSSDFVNIRKNFHLRPSADARLSHFRAVSSSYVLLSALKMRPL
jgi:ferrochelatase